MATGEITIPIALVHTAIAMGTVFLVLILISFVIWLLKFVPKIINALSKDKNVTEQKNAPQAKTAAPAAKPAAAVKKSTDGEIVAAIAAAIAATMTEETGVPVSPEGLVIRSIKKRSF